MRRLSSLVVCALVLSGCDGFDSPWNGTPASMSGAGVVLRKPYEAYSAANLSELIVSSTPHYVPPSSTAPGPPGSTSSFYPPRDVDPSGKDLGYNLDSTIGWFPKQLRALPPSGVTISQQQNDMRDARNEIQGMLLTASANRCNAFKQLLRERSTNINFFLGTLATTLGAAGAIVSGGASQALAGAAAATTGASSEYNRDILSNVTSTVIIPGIDKQRSGILQEITNRRCLGISSYALSDALLDAVRYHTACSTDVGVAAAGAALTQSGTSKATTLAEATSVMKATQAFALSMKTDGESAKPGSGTTPTHHHGHHAAGGSAAANPHGALEVSKASDPPPAPAAADTANANTPDGTSKKSSVLVGDTVTYPQCDPLDDNGAPVKAGATSTGSAKQADQDK